MKKLYIFRGLPGSGKSTHARELAPMVVEPDMFRYNADNEYVFDSDKNTEVYDKAYDLLTYAMRHLKMPSLAIAATHTKIDHIRKYVDSAKKHGYTVFVVECYGDYGNIHNVPESVIAKMGKEFEPLGMDDVHAMGVSIIRYRKGEAPCHGV